MPQVWLPARRGANGWRPRGSRPHPRPGRDERCAFPGAIVGASAMAEGVGISSGFGIVVTQAESAGAGLIGRAQLAIQGLELISQERAAVFGDLVEVAVDDRWETFPPVGLEPAANGINPPGQLQIKIIQVRIALSAHRPFGLSSSVSSRGFGVRRRSGLASATFAEVDAPAN